LLETRISKKQFIGRMLSVLVRLRLCAVAHEPSLFEQRITVGTPQRIDGVEAIDATGRGHSAFRAPTLFN